MKYFLIIIVFVVIIICCVNGCQNLMIGQRGGKIVENGYSFVGAKKIECDGHQFYLMQTRTPIYIHAYDCECGEVSSVDSTLCKLYGIVK